MKSCLYIREDVDTNLESKICAYKKKEGKELVQKTFLDENKV